MSQPQVLKHSHTPFRKRTEGQVPDLSNSDSESEDINPGAGQDRVNAPDQPSDQPTDEQQSSDRASEDESVSASALEEELERAEFDPFDGSGMHHGPEIMTSLTNQKQN